jgi:glycosyltransferase involved in cell wall biosynthesis
MGRLAAVWRIWRRHGTFRLLQWWLSRRWPNLFLLPSAVRYEDAIAAGGDRPHPAVERPALVTRERLIVGWIMPPPVGSSGGHQNIFRFIRVLEEVGHEVRILLYGASGYTDPEAIRRLVSGSGHFSDITASIEPYPDGGVAPDIDVLIATSWPTAYRSYRDASPARRLYFVQDFEPAFYPVSSESVLAENSYRLGFFGITAGKWLEGKLHRDYGMPTASYDFGSDPGVYTLTGDGERTEIFFYARPSTPRRGFELGVMALDLFHRDRPDFRINLVGQSLKGLSIPFPHVAPGSLGPAELNALYNRCRAGLVISLSNLSLLPLELLSAGVVPVLNDGENNRAVTENPFIEYAPPVPRGLADRLVTVVDRPDAAEHARRAAASVESASWETSAQQFLAAFERGASGR